jgi:tetratricopeptide (TPR) repeat protein
MAPDWISPELAQQIKDEYPSCISVAFVLLEAQLNKATPQPEALINALRSAFEISLATTAICALCDLICRDAVSCDARLSESVRKLSLPSGGISTGTWWELLRDTLMTANHKDQGFASELARRHDEREGAPSMDKTDIKRLCELRNWNAHAHLRDDESIERATHEHLPLLARWLGVLSVFRSWSLIFPASSPRTSDATFIYDGQVFSGNRRVLELRTFSAPTSLHGPKVWLVRTSALGTHRSSSRTVSVDEGSLLPLSPLILLLEQQNPARQALLLYNGATSSHARYKDVFTSSDTLESLDDVRGFLSTPPAHTAGRSRNADSAISGVSQGCREITAEYVERMIQQRIYRAETYAHRAHVEEHLQHFRASQLPAALLIAPSGMGKTCLITRLGERSIKDSGGQHTVGVLHADRILQSHGLAGVLTSILRPRYSSPHANGGFEELRELVTELGRTVSKRHTWTCLFVIDGIDRHANPLRLMAELVATAEIFKTSRHLKILGTCTTSIVDTFMRAAGRLDPGVFYRPISSIADARSVQIPGVSLPALTDDELASSYKAYQNAGSAPLTQFDDLSAAMKDTLSNPLILRLAMDVYADQHLPRQVFGLAMLQKFVSKNVFEDPTRLDFVAELVDLMIADDQRSLSFERLRTHPLLRTYILDSSHDSVVNKLCEESILTRNDRAHPDNLPFPASSHLEFTFERVLEYLIFWRTTICQQSRPDKLGYLLDRSRQFPTARGALLLLCVHMVKEGCYASLVSLFHRASDDWLTEFWKDLFVELVDVWDEFQQGRPGEFLNALSQQDADRALGLAVRSAEELFILGRWQDSSRVLGMVSEVSMASRNLRTQQLNRRVLLQKNMDVWEEAHKSSDQCLELLDDDSPADLVARVLVNRSSVLYDLGMRIEALQCLDRARNNAANNLVVLAAIENNTGLYRLFHDELDEAERCFRTGLQLTKDSELQQAYLETNLSLTLFSRSRTDPAVLAEARMLCESARNHFDLVGHLQGVSYTTSNLGLFHLRDGNLSDASACFVHTQELARRLREKWSDYGALLNLACVELARKKVDLAFEMAHTSMELARRNQDRKGVGDAGIVAGCAGLRSLRSSKDGKIAHEDVVEILSEAHQAFGELDQPLGVAMTARGLIDLGCPPENAEIRMGTSATTLAAERCRQFEPLPCYLFLLMEVF